jgi:hypothetical protein
MRPDYTELEIECAQFWTTNCSIFDYPLAVAKVGIEYNHTVNLVRFY